MDIKSNLIHSHRRPPYGFSFCELICTAALRLFYHLEVSVSSNVPYSCIQIDHGKMKRYGLLLVLRSNGKLRVTLRIKIDTLLSEKLNSIMKKIPKSQKLTCPFLPPLFFDIASITIHSDIKHPLRGNF